jgi:hypothetical protein
MTDTLGAVFEELARAMLARCPTIPHEWRPIPSRWFGDRLDLVCNPNTADEVWASIRPSTITVGTGDDHDDFADSAKIFPRPRSRARRWSISSCYCVRTAIPEPPAD